ncbi:MAG: DNA topoisomerase IB [Flavipsychrobacter sp.]|nr:DNA topoisomerase IB [Flavipsychrobacter sp.]
MEATGEIKLSRRKLRSISSDGVKTAKAVNLVYVTDKDAGITRKRTSDGFSYYHKGREVRKEETLFRIRSLVLPPAWEQVWICASANGHLQATGIDARGRKQYKYHPLWNNLRNQTKFFHLHDFGAALPGLRSQLQKHLAKQGLPLEKVLATVVSLMECTCIRIGNSAYEKLYGSFGLTTLKDQHVTIKGHEVKFSFKGKKGVSHNISLRSRRLARIVKQCRDIPGKELFQYYDDNGQRKTIDSGMVNNYIKEISGGNFTAKDFRTWWGSLYALQALKELGEATTETAAKRNIAAALDSVARQLGNTRTVCKKYYVHPHILDLYSAHSLGKYFRKSDQYECGSQVGLSVEEQVLMNILERSGSASIAA